jgi:hypothetical protein
MSDVVIGRRQHLLDEANQRKSTAIRTVDVFSIGRFPRQ